MENFDIMRCYSGSLAYGTNLPTSDVDIRGIFCAPERSIRTPFFPIEELTLEEEEDGKIYELTNFFKLFLNMNPNILELMFVDEKDILQTSDVYEYLRQHAPALLSKKVAHTFSGYAMAQLKRIKGHDKWINNPQPEELPTQREYLRLTHSFMEEKMLKHQDFQYVLDRLDKVCVFLPMGGDIYGIIGSSGQPGGLFNADGTMRRVDYDSLSDEDKKRQPSLIVKYLSEEHKSAKEKHRNYWKWKAERNETRHQLEVDYGYDCYLDSETEFLTERGFKKYDDILDDERVATVNPETKALEYQYPLERVKKPYSGVIYNGCNQDTQFTVTGNHRMFVSNVCRSKGTKYQEDLAQWRYASLESLIQENQSYYHMLHTFDNHNEDYPITDDALVLIGAYLSEGSFVRYKGRPKGISISQLEGGRLCKYLDKVVVYDLKKYSHERKGRTELTYNFYDTKIAGEFLEMCGEYEATKKMPSFVNSLSKRQANLLLDVMIAGDGTERAWSRVYYTSSPYLTDGVQLLALLAGKASKVWGYLEKHGTNQVYISEQRAKPSVFRTSGHIGKRNVDNEHIVCFTVPNENLVTRNGGKIAIQGNTKHAMHLVRLMRMGEEILTTGQVLVKRPDAQELLDIRAGKWTLDELLAWADEKDKLIRGELYKNSSLQHSGNYDLAAKVLMRAQDMCWAKK